ncbi:MAG: hypothetical protein ABII12_10875 [Planctomycetota bacterium]
MIWKDGGQRSVMKMALKIPTHDVRELQRRFFRSLGDLNKALHAFTLSFDHHRRRADEHSRQDLLRGIDSWNVDFTFLRLSLPRQLPPFVRSDLWAQLELPASVQISFRLMEGYSVADLPKEQRAEVEQGGGPADYRFGPDKVSLDVLEHPALTAICPDLRSVIHGARNRFRQYKQMAVEQRADFRLKPIRIDDVIPEIVSILRPMETTAYRRTVEKWPEDSGQRCYAGALEDVLEQTGPSCGGDIKTIQDGLHDVWPDIGKSQINAGILEAFKAGLIRANGGMEAFNQGSSPTKTGEIEDDLKLDEWLTRNRVGYSFPLVFRLTEGALASDEDSTVKSADPADKPLGNRPNITSPKLGPHDRQAFQLSKLVGWTQQRIADELNKEHGTLYSQGQVSRMIARMEQYVVASGLSQLNPEPPKQAKSINPDRLELGQRSDRLTSRQRPQRDPDAE